MTIHQYTAANFLRPAEKQAIENINNALDDDADPGLWADCGEVDAPTLVDAVERLSQEVCKLYAFKEYVHATLDAAGIDKHEEQNATTGCRVGARLRDVIKAPAPAVAGWVSVADGLPVPEEGYTEFSPWVLAYTTRGQQIQASYYGPLKGWRTPTGRADVTHWMPQPTPPATMEGGQPNV